MLPLFLLVNPAAQGLIVKCRKLAKKVQTELAEANSVAEEVITSMPTVKAHAAELSASASYSARLAKFFSLQVGPTL